MKIYHYHPATLNLLGDGFADLDPLNHSNWLVPAYATKVEPPADQAGKTIHFMDGVWAYQDIPVPVPESPPDPLTYAQLRAAEYPPMVDLIDGLVKDDAAQVQSYKDACLAVKAKYPKP